MTPLRTDVIGIGNAIVDVIARTEDDFLVAHGMRKGTMALIDEARAGAIYDAMGAAVEISGGSAANTIVGVASLGARAAFVGKVKHDVLGGVFAHDIKAAGVGFATPAAAGGPSTGRCYVLVTPDGERTMNTFLGAAQDLHPDDIDADAIASAVDHFVLVVDWGRTTLDEIERGLARSTAVADRVLGFVLNKADRDTIGLRA